MTKDFCFCLHDLKRRIVVLCNDWDPGDRSKKTRQNVQVISCTFLSCVSAMLLCMSQCTSTLLNVLLEGTSIYSWIGTLHPKGIKKPRIPNSCVAYKEVGEGREQERKLYYVLVIEPLLQALSVLLLEILNLNLLNPKLIEVP